MQNIEAASDRALSIELDRHLEQTYGGDEEENFRAQEAREAAASERRISNALDYAKLLIDEPVTEAIAILRDEYGLSAKQLETVIRRWVMA